MIDEVLNFTTTINFRPFLKVIFPEHSRSFVAIVYKHFPIQAAEPIRKPYEIWHLNSTLSLFVLYKIKVIQLRLVIIQNPICSNNKRQRIDIFDGNNTAYVVDISKYVGWCSHLDTTIVNLNLIPGRCLNSTFR